MPKIISSSTLRNGYNDISSWCHATQEPVFITKNGNGDLAVMSIAAYESLTERTHIYDELALGHADVVAGRTRPAREALSELREKYGLS